jgi:hypothetical protein
MKLISNQVGVNSERLEDVASLFHAVSRLVSGGDIAISK